jgi:hypothetical protein
MLSTESSYAAIAKQFGVKETTVIDFLTKDIKAVRTSYNSSPGYRKLYNAAAKNHNKDLKTLAKQQGKEYFEIPILERGFRPPQYFHYRREAYKVSRRNRAQRAELFAKAARTREPVRNVERDYEAAIGRKEAKAVLFQLNQARKHKPVRLYDFLEVASNEEEIQEYVNDVVEIYKLTEDKQEEIWEYIEDYFGGFES